MTAVLAAAARAVLAAVLVLAALASLLWTAYGPQGLWTVAWLAVVFAVVTGAGLGIAALQPKVREPLTERQLEVGRHVIDYDDKGFPCLGSDCPECNATALIINEWDAVECLSCSWREFGPDDARADYSKWPDESRAIPGAW